MYSGSLFPINCPAANTMRRRRLASGDVYARQRRVVYDAVNKRCERKRK